MKQSAVAFILIACSLALASCTSREDSYAPDPGAVKILNHVTTHSLMGHIRFLSDDLLEGRGPNTRSDKLTQAYIASQMEMLGLQPGGDNGSYLQAFPMVSTTVDPSISLTFKSKGKSIELRNRAEFVGVAGRQQERVEIRDAELVFVGYGIEAPEQDWDDYKNVDVKGKILLFMNNDPAGDDPAFFGGNARTYYGRWTYKYEIAAAKGAAGAIVIHTDESAGYGWNVVENSWSRERFALANDPAGPSTLFNGWTTSAATEKILSLSGHSLDELMKSGESKSFTPVPLGITMSTVVKTTIKTATSANVIGVLPGSDPVLKNEAVVFTAHHDHLGITAPVNGDSINNGAMDNATGVSALLNIAAMFISLDEKPKRSIVFAAVGAEESGTLGSEHYVLNPLFPMSKTAANINIDGMNVLGKTGDVIMIGYGKSNIDKILEDVAGWQKRIVKPDQFPEQGAFYRSDQFNFAKAGVPCMYLRAGLDYIGKPPEFAQEKVREYVRTRYHQPSDEITPDWDLSGAVEDIQLTFLVGHDIANRKEAPRWNAGDEFETARLKSLGE